MRGHVPVIFANPDSRAVGAVGAASQCASANPTDGDRARGRLSACSNVPLVNAARGLVKSYGQRLPQDVVTRQVQRELGWDCTRVARGRNRAQRSGSLKREHSEYEVRMEKIRKEKLRHVGLLTE